MQVLGGAGVDVRDFHLLEATQADGDIAHEAAGMASVRALVKAPEFTILIPCLNEVETLGACIREAHDAIAAAGIDAEIVVSDNGSDDGSKQLAESEGARVVDAPMRGYGAALIAGIDAARGTYILTIDADGSHDLGALPSYIEELRKGNDLVMGNRFQGGIEDGAMPALHRYLGNPVLSFLGRRLFRVSIGDFHCGMRGFRRDAIRSLGLCMTGMEFASEMIVRAALADLSIAEVPTFLRRDKRTRAPHLRTWRDGWRHLRFLVAFNPSAMLVRPGLGLFGLGLAASAMLAVGPRTVAGVQLDINALVVTCFAVLVGLQTALLGGCAVLYGSKEGLTSVRRTDRWARLLRLETCVSVGMGLAVLGLAGTLVALQRNPAGLGQLDQASAFRVLLPSATAVAAGAMFVSFGLVSFLVMARETRRPRERVELGTLGSAVVVEGAVSAPPRSGHELKRHAADPIVVLPRNLPVTVRLEPTRVGVRRANSGG